MMFCVFDGAWSFVKDKSRERIYTDRPDANTLSPEELASLNGMALGAFKILLLFSFKVGGNEANLLNIYI